jgi:hypothetical protein
MSRTITQFRALSGSNYVYFTSEEIEPSNISAKTIVSTFAKPLEYHDLTFDPIEIWQFDGTMSASINSGNTLTVSTGSERYGPSPTIGGQSFFFGGDTRLTSSVTASLQLTGAMTLEMLVYPASPTSAASQEYVLVRHQTGGEAENTNALYSVSLGASVSGGETGPNVLTAFFESGSGADTNLVTSPLFSIEPGRWHHIAYTRTSVTGNFLYHNGILQNLMPATTVNL